MPVRRILIVQGHPDATGAHFGHALAARYAAGADQAGSMPALLFRWFFLAHGVRQLQRNVLGFVGIAPVRTTLIGLVEGNAHRRTAWLDRLLALGSRGL